HMGGEGGAWIGIAPFSKIPHIFQNMGDGTYFHSGLLAIRAAIAAGVNITYKILYNDAVALTGGQPVEGGLEVWDISRQLAAEGVGRIALISDEPDKYPAGTNFAPGMEIHHRRALDAVQCEFRTEPGVTAIIYDQTCAAEKRRRRKRGLYPDPAERLFINQDVCDGCGACNEASNCVALWPLETPLGRKRRIDQSSCNKDFSCLEGFCPSFVTVEGGSLLQTQPMEASESDPAAHLPDPAPAPMGHTYNVLLSGIGGTGVVTAGALLGTAAHLEGKGCSVLDQTGLAQKNGAVTSHLRLAADPGAVLGTRIGTGMADLVLGFDMVVAAGPEAVLCMSGERTKAVINDHLVPLALFAEKPDLPFAAGPYPEVIKAALGTAGLHLVDATRLAGRLLGDSISSNIFLMGYAYQSGLLPLGAQSIRRAIELNGVAV
ncbi:MAG: 2-oxoacid:acceptor oxidoreductase family protein, partial [Rhodospirillales bacterium]|nr:2-oxoacid:acceptor oxidoreductase family protein [Rhodospirillales bacterium]